MVFEVLANQIEAEFSGRRALEQVAAIYRFDRYFTFAHFHRSGQYCAEEMGRIGLDEVELLEYAADGRTAYGDWVIPRAWDVEEAELRLVSPWEERLVCWSDVPHCLSLCSAPTPPTGVEAEVLFLPDEAAPGDPLAAQAAGKILFGRDRPAELQKRAVEWGSLGFISDCGRRDVYDATPWDNYALAPRNEEGLFGFMLSPRQGDRLREAFQRARRKGQPVRVRARVDSRLYDGTIPMVTGVIRGETEEEILALAHLYEAGANDNTSGCGALLEAFRSLAALIRRGDLPRPKRRLRLLLGFECAGFMAYLVHHRERLPKMIAGLNLDMVGQNQNRSECLLSVVQTPHSQPSFTGTLLKRLVEERIAKRDPLWRWQVRPFSGGDNQVSDPMIGIPTPGLWQHPERFYHSSEDTLDKVDPESLRKIGSVAATYLYFLAQAGPREAAWLAHEVAAEGKKRLASEAARWVTRPAQRADEIATAGAVDSRELRERLDYLVDRQMAALDSTATLLSGSRPEGWNLLLEALKGDLREQAGREWERAKAVLRLAAGASVRDGGAPPLSDREQRAAQLVVHRERFGSLTLETLPPEARPDCRWGPGWIAPYAQHFYWFDGQRTLLEAVRLMEQELGKVDLEDLMAYLEFLEKYGYVRLERRE